MDTTQGYIKYFFVLSNIILTSFILYIGSFIFSPLLAAFIVAILLQPIYHKSRKLGLARAISAAISVLVFLFAILFLISSVTTQIKFITADPSLSETSFSQVINSGQLWIAHVLPYSLQEQSKFLEASYANFLKNVVGSLPNIFSITTGFLATFLLFTLSLFFFLYYNHFFMGFIHKVFGHGKKEKITETALKIRSAVKNYIVGLFIVILIVATLNSLGLLLLGVHHAIFFGSLAAVLTIMPYIGIIIGSLLPAFFSLLSSNSWWDPVIIIILFSFVQFLEGNFITPIIIGSKENINPYVAILGLFIGGSLLGATGIIFAIPLLGIIKIICEQVNSLKSIAYVMGNPDDGNFTVNKWFSSVFKFKNNKKRH